MKKIVLIIAVLIAISAQAAHVTVAPATCYIVGSSAPYNTLHGGDTLFMTNGNKAYICLLNFTGNSSHPIVVINQGGIVTIGTNFTYGIKLGNCRYIKFTGTGTNDQYGFSVTQTNGDGVSIGDLSSDIEIEHIHVNNCGIRGIVAKTDPACGGYAYRKNFTQYNTLIHDNLIENTTTEGMYIGSSFYSGETLTCSGHDSTVLPSILNHTQIYNNIVRHTGYDGIQAASSLDLSIHDNLVQWDSQSGVSSQMSGILIGGGSQGDCYNNYIQNGKGDGIENLGLGGYKIYNNVIVNAGINYTATNKYGIYTNDNSATVGSEFDIMFNTIINPRTNGIRFSSNNATASVIENNAIILASGNYISNDGYSGITIRNNYTATATNLAKFVDTTYKTQSTSPLINAGYNETKGITTDKFGNTRSTGIPDCGVYEANYAPITYTVTGNVVECPSTANQVYSTTTNGTWTVPTGWTIVSGQGTKSITVTTGIVGNNGSVSVIIGGNTYSMVVVVVKCNCPCNN